MIDEIIWNENVKTVSVIHGTGDQEPGVRLKTSMARPIDWSLLLRRISANSGASFREISEVSGLSQAFISKLNCDKQGFASGDRAIILLDLFLMYNNGAPVPRVGDPG